MRRWMIPVLMVLAAVAFTGPAPFAQESAPVRVQDVIYGRKAALALTMDVVKPVKPNGIGVLCMMSGGWNSSPDMIPLMQGVLKPAIDRGFTMFMVVHGTQPKFTIPEIVQDIDRATR